MKIVEVKHPLVKHKLGLMRENDISTKRFRELASEVGSLLPYEATADLETEKVTIDGWCGPVEIDQIKGKKITVVPILRAGLGMEKAHPDVELYTASIDQCLNEKGYIVPGLGDAGDKIFGTK